MDSIQFEIIITFITFIFFFTIGYSSEKKSSEKQSEKESDITKSGGFFLIFSGFVFLYLEYILIDNSIMNIYYVGSLMSIIGLYIIIIGVYKAFYE